MHDTLFFISFKRLIISYSFLYFPPREVGNTTAVSAVGSYSELVFNSPLPRLVNKLVASNVIEEPREKLSGFRFLRFLPIYSFDRSYRNDRFSFVAFALFVQIALKWKNLSLIRSFLPHLVGISLRFFKYSFIDVDPFVFFWIYELFFFSWIASWGKALT